MKKSAAPGTIVDFDLRQLEVFSKVVELGSFSKAAEAVFLAQASVSERVATLEGMVGTRLLDRLGRRIVPTRAGEMLYRHARKLLEMKAAARMELQDFLGLKRGEIRMGGSTIPGEYILPRVIGRFLRTYPLINIVVDIADSEEIETRLLKGHIELAVIGRKGSNRNLESRRLWGDELVVVVPAGHPWARSKEVTFGELSGAPFLSRGPGSATLRSLEDRLKAAGVRGVESFNVVASMGTSTAVKEGIKAGIGVSVLSSRAVETEVKTGILKTLRLKGVAMVRRFYLIRDRRMTLSPPCRELHDFLFRTAGESQDP
jgi:DNA-binding transcriptional LysR family regulator